MNEVGTLSFENEKVFILANYNNATLTANYDMSKMSTFSDIEISSVTFDIFGEWNVEINFEIENSNISKLSGKILLTCSIDFAYGVNCVCRPLITCEIPNKEKINLTILQHGLTFGLDIKTDDSSEKIEIRPFDDLNGFFIHDIRKRINDDIEKQYQKYSGIVSAGGTIENEDKLRLFLIEEDNDETINFYNEHVQKIDEKNFNDSVVQKGILMKKLDPTTFDKIKEVRNHLTIDGISILENLINVCYDSYTDEQIEALLDLKREKMCYQDGSNSLINSYFGIDKNSCFLTPETQKRLTKK